MPLPALLYPRALGAAALLLAALAPPAHAQYAWIDAGGTRVFSDRPPPPGTPPSRILKQPRSAAVAPYGAGAIDPAPVPAQEPAAKAPAAPTVAEREADYRARMAKQKEGDEKAAKEARQQSVKASRCNGLKRQEMALTAQARLTEFDEKGERRYIGDEERAGRLVEVRRQQAEECR